ncbi:MAG: hydrolase [Planctomycetes bacterium GWF2_41_51]|nr:MAG: hydrolase [Planctomycetes bacterium GWF2_41_51]HBG27945.1 hydrolase [Phycisphaerales bacterium]
MHKIIKKKEKIEIGINDKIIVAGSFNIVHKGKGVILFAHGSGSSRFSHRNNYVANLLKDSNFNTLLIDLLTKEEEAIDLQTAQLRFDIELLAARVIAATEWLCQNKSIGRLPIGYYDASTGAAAALVAASELGDLISAVVSRGGRPDLAGDKLSKVKAPTLLIVGGEDHTVIEMNKDALGHLNVKKELSIIPGATHLFEEPGTLKQAALKAAEWFERYLSKK